MSYTPTIAVDFDQTICNSSFPDCGPVMPGVREAFILFKSMGFRILIWTCRTSHWHDELFNQDSSIAVTERPTVKRMAAWLTANQIPYDEIDDGSRGKPLAEYYIDDKGIRFENNWYEIASFIFRRTQNATN